MSDNTKDKLEEIKGLLLDNVIDGLRSEEPSAALLRIAAQLAKDNGGYIEELPSTVPIDSQFMDNLPFETEQDVVEARSGAAKSHQAKRFH